MLVVSHHNHSTIIRTASATFTPTISAQVATNAT